MEEASHYKRGKLSMYMTKPRRVRRNKRKCKICATRSRKRASPQVRSPIKNFMNRCARLASISVVILIRTDTTLDHSQKAEKVCRRRSGALRHPFPGILEPSIPPSPDLARLKTPKSQSYLPYMTALGCSLPSGKGLFSRLEALIRLWPNKN